MKRYFLIAIIVFLNAMTSYAYVLNPGECFSDKHAKWKVVRVDGNIREVELVGYQYQQKNVEIPRNVEYENISYEVVSIGKGAFINDTSLVSITLPYTIREIGDCAFFGCKRLTTVSGGNTYSSIQVIGNKAFCNCISLTTFMPRSLRDIDNPNGYCSPVNVRCKSLGYSVFKNCTSLTSVVLAVRNNPSYCTLGDNAFEGCCALKCVYLIKFDTMGKRIFSGCTALTRITSTCSSFPSFSTDDFSEEQKQDIEVIVPTESLADYQEAFVWKDFLNLRGGAESETIEDAIVADIKKTSIRTINNESIYNLQGICVLRDASKQQIKSLPKGFYIVNGKKVLMK